MPRNPPRFYRSQKGLCRVMVRRGLTLFWCLLVLQIIWRIFFTPIWRIVQLDRLRTRLTPALIARDDPAAISGAEKPSLFNDFRAL
jgi:hypothetical protein